MAVIPKDPLILLSYLNTQLRDRYTSLEALCEDMGLEAMQIREKLATVGFSYDEEKNQFR
ncbi:MAG: DUF4250 domain-containing protein [Clostridiales bacterium]|nr:DUF4250 domain-containing protein [Clostridiales bacterium]